MIFYAKNNIPEEGWKKYRKITLTKAIKINEPFMVKTLEGDMFCTDGYLAMDVQGNPYPIETKVFNDSYVEVKEDEEVRRG